MECLKGFDAILHVTKNQKCYIGLGNKYKFRVLKSKTAIPNSVEVDGFYYSHKIMYIEKMTTTISDDFSFYENLIPALRDPLGIAKELQLEKFVDNQISLSDLAKSVSENYHVCLTNYYNLQKIARGYRSENPHIHGFIRSKIAEFLQPISVEKISG